MLQRPRKILLRRGRPNPQPPPQTCLHCLEAHPKPIGDPYRYCPRKNRCKQCKKTGLCAEGPRRYTNELFCERCVLQLIHEEGLLPFWETNQEHIQRAGIQWLWYDPLQMSRQNYARACWVETFGGARPTESEEQRYLRWLQLGARLGDPYARVLFMPEQG